MSETAQEDEPPSHPEEINMRDNLHEFFDTTIREVMVPRTSMITIEKDQTIQEAVSLINDTGHSRIPVQSETKDNIVGILYAKDLFKFFDAPRDTKVSEVMRKAHFAYYSQQIHQLLSTFKKLRTHVAIIVDEYGGVDGMATIEDVIEELVGEIEDEFDQETTPNYQQIEGAIIFTADYLLDDFNEIFKTNFEKEGVETIGGYICHVLGKIPEKNERFELGNLRFKITERHDRMISKLKVKGVCLLKDQ